jgi:predicted nucleic acid-binding protein
MNAEKITLDTNILVYAVDKEAGYRHQRAIGVFKQMRGLNCVLTLQALSEFFVVVTRKQKMPRTEAVAQVNDWQQLFPVICATPNSLTKALQAVPTHQLAFWDALLWATAQETNVTLLLSEDFQHGRVLEGVRFVNPFLPGAY